MSLDVTPAAPPAMPQGNPAVATGPPGSSADSATGSGPPIVGKNDLFALMLASRTEAAGPLPTKTTNTKTPTADVPSNTKENHTSSKEDAAASDTDGKVTQEPNQTLNEMLAAGLQALPAPNAAAQVLPTNATPINLKSGSNSAATGQNSITKTTASDNAVVGQKTLDAMDTRSSAISPASTQQGGGNDSGSLSENSQAPGQTLPLMPPAVATPSANDTASSTATRSVNAVKSNLAGASTSSSPSVPSASLLSATAELGSASVRSAEIASAPTKAASSIYEAPTDTPSVESELSTTRPAPLTAATPTAAAAPAADSSSATAQETKSAAQLQGASAVPTTAAGRNTLPAQPLPTVLPVTQSPQTGVITAQFTLQNIAVPANNTGKETASAIVSPTNGKTANAAKTTASRTSSGRSVVNAASPAVTAKSNVIAPPSGADDESSDGSSGSPNAKSQHKTAADLAISAGSTDAQSARTEDSETVPSVSTAGVEKQTTVTVGATAPLTGAERAQVIRQAADAMTQLQPGVKSPGASQMTLNLHPQEWGKLQVSVQMTTARADDGTTSTGVVAHIVASDAAVKSALELHTADLHQALAETGLKLDRLSVTVQAADAATKSDLSGSGQSFGQSLGQNDAQSRQTPDAPQTALSNNNAGTTTFGGSSSFSGYFEGRGERTGQGQAQSRSTGSGEGSDLEMAPAISARTTAVARGSFDGRA